MYTHAQNPLSYTKEPIKNKKDDLTTGISQALFLWFLSSAQTDTHNFLLDTHFVFEKFPKLQEESCLENAFLKLWSPPL